jgi:hypothetical protein
MLPDQKKSKDLANYLLLGLFLFIAYLPLSSLLFALKNDALTENFPNKYFLSAALHSGHFPLWNPYINFGLPLYADPGFSFWHPLTWLFGLIGYNLYTLSVEILVYIWLGGIFMYQLGKFLRHPPAVCISMAAMFICCGFFIGNLEHTNFLTCAAFLPLVTRTFLQLHEKFSFSRLLACILSLYLLSTGGHPAIPFATIYFLTIISLGLPFFGRPAPSLDLISTASDPMPLASGPRPFPLPRLLKTNALLIFGFALIAAPLLYSYFEIFPWFARSMPVTQLNTLKLGFTLPSYLSFLLPFGTTAKADFFGNDLLMRNGYFSFIGFAFLITAIIQRKNNYQRLFLIAGAAMLLLSLGGNLKNDLYSNLPLLQYIRANGELRVFALFSFIIVASFPLARWIDARHSPVATSSVFRKILMLFAVISAAIILWIALHPATSTLLFGSFRSVGSLTAPGLHARIKWWLIQFTFADRLLINASILLLFLLIFFLFEKKIARKGWLPAFVLTDLVLFCWLHLPVTGVQQKSPPEIQRHYFASVRPGIPIPNLQPIKDNIWPGEDLRTTIGSWSYYSKQPGAPEMGNYPSLLTNTRDYFQSPLPAILNAKPFVFLNGEPGRALSLTAYSADRLVLEIGPGEPDTLVLLQNIYPAWSATVNGIPVPIHKEYMAFMGVPMEKGQQKIVFDFRPIALRWPISLAFLALVMGIILVLYEQRRATRDAKNLSLRTDTPDP